MPETTTTKNMIQATVYSCLYQMRYSTSITSLKLPPYGKQYPCFKSDGKFTHESQCAKSRELTKFIDLILDIESFEQICVIIKGLSQSD